MYPGTVPEGPPQSLSAAADFPGTITVSWTTPSVALQNGVITHYRVSYTSDPSQPVGQRQYHSVTGTMTRLTGLQSLVNYTIAVSAGTKVGLGPFIQTVVTTLILSKCIIILVLYSYYYLMCQYIFYHSHHHHP